MTVDHVSKEFALQTMKADLSPGNKLSQHFCSIQVTSENGALCIINPLFIHEHGDRWLTNISQSQKKEKRRSVPWCCQQSVKIKTMRTPLVKEDTPDKISDEAEDKEENNQDETEWHLDIFKKLGMDEAYKEFPQQQEEESKNVHNVKEPSDTHQEDTNIVRTFAVTPGSESKDQTKVECTGFRKDTTKLEEAHKVDNVTEEKKLHFPHRVSWIEAEHVAEVSLKKSNSETSLISSDSFLLPPLSELDSASISSVEDEKDCHSSPRRRKHPHGLGDIVRHSFLAVSTVLTGFVSPEKHLGNRIQQIAEDPSSYLGCKVQTFIGQFKEFSQHQSSTELLQEIRQELTDLKNYLLESNEIWEIVEHHGIEDSKIASIIETSLHKCLLKPLRGKIYSQLIDIYNRDGSLTRLLSNQKRMKVRSLFSKESVAGLPGVGVMEKIQQKLLLMHMAYSPEKMIIFLLKVCKLIYESMEAASIKKEAFGADDFLPVLIQVLMGCDLTSLQLDVEYMMELGDPSLLQGEGGYYLTTMFGALYHISSFNMVSRQLSTEAQNSIRQWQRRRTIHHKHSLQKTVRIVRKKGI